MRPDTLRRRPAASAVFSLALFICALAFASEARAIEIQVEILIDSLAQPPAPLSNVCTLRKAVNNANDNDITYPQCQGGEAGGPGGVTDTIIFYLPGTVTFALGGAGEEGGETGDLDITDDLTIIGHADGTTIDAADLDRIFHVHPGATLTLVNIHITDGSGNDGGGGIRVEAGATLNLDRVTISSCHTQNGDGGGIELNGGTVNITNSTLSGNSTSFIGGAMTMNGGVALITNSTVTANFSTTGLAGGINAGGLLTMRSSVLVGNTNASIVNGVPNFSGTINSNGYNVIGDPGTPPNNGTFFAQPTDQVGVTPAQANLGPLAPNGAAVPTHALLPGSVAIDKGHSSGSTVDQRGLTRPCDLPDVANASGGDGGDAGAFEVQGACAGSNSNPDAVDDNFAVSEDSGPNAFNVLANDTDADGDALTVSAVTQGAHGSVVMGGDNTVSYTPAANYFGPDSFTYTASDGNGGTDTATVNVSVANVQDAPVAANDAANVNEDSAANVINVLANDGDADGDPLAVVSVTQGAHGSVTNNGANVSYTPAPDYFGADSFTYTVSDGQGGLATATVDINVANVNDAPAATGDVYGMNQDTTLTVNPPGVLANDTDVDGDALSAVLATSTTNGSLGFNADGSFVYTPNAGFTGLDSFTYTANDGAADSEVVTVNITVADTQGPNLTTSVATTMLWPPNHELVNVGLSVNATDNSGDPVTTQVFVFSDEDDLTPASPSFSPDARDIAPATLRLRAERDGTGDGRVYLVVVVATDSSNNVSRNCLTVVVPHGNSKASRDAVGQQAQAALAHCAANGTPPAGYFVVGDGPAAGPKQ
ncbi:MAG TPA: cadherin-like domain-containing protein [Pyrinomonadaceae bacterium]|nr:cadherin-like domain-containing protein [Pyrinomonadaceae bacterium]